MSILVPKFSIDDATLFDYKTVCVSMIDDGHIYSGFSFPFEVTRTNRKRSVSIQIKDGEVTVIVPKTLSARSIEGMIQNKNLGLGCSLGFNPRLFH